MRNVTLSQSDKTYLGVTQSAINTSDISFGYYRVPLNIRNEKYPNDFKVLPSEQLNFPLIDDEVPLNLGDKIDYKDYINFTDNLGNNYYAIVNPVKRSVLQEDDKYKKVSSIENGEVIPPPYGRGQNIAVQIPQISVSIDSLSNESASLYNKNSQVLIPVIIPIISNGNNYQFESTNIPPNSSVRFNLIKYKGIFKDEIKMAAVNIKVDTIDD